MICGTQEVLGFCLAVHKGTEMYTAPEFKLLVSGDSCIRVDFHIITCDV
jgi:hypothetical protein